MNKTILRLILTLLCVFAITGMAAQLERRGLKSCYKKAALTMYWIPKEGDVDMLNNGKVVKLSGSKTKALKTKSGSTIAKVSSVTYSKFQMEGTGLLTNGVMVNLGESNNQFMKVNRKATPYGLGSNSKGLTPWVSVAANDIKRGTTLYVKQLDGLKLPDGRTHNGCVRVDDQGWGFDDCQIDFFVLQYSAYKTLSKKLPSRVQVVQKNCKVLGYVTKEVQRWAVL